MESISFDQASSMRTRIRFVTCPTCREILPESHEIPLYKCGRCATIIEAKNCNIGRSVSETNPVKKHKNSCRATGKDKANDYDVDPCSTSKRSHSNENYPAQEEHTKGDESMYLPRENNRKSPNEFPGKILESCPNSESAEGILTAVEGHKVERSSKVAKEYKVLDENNASHLQGFLKLEEGNETEAVLGTLNQSILTESLPKDDKYFKKTQKKLQNFGSPGPEEISESLPHNPRSPRGSISKSPPQICYACDERNFKGTGDISANRPPLKDRWRFKKRQNGQLMIVHEPTASSSMSKVKNDFTSTGSGWKHYKVPEARNKMREGNNDYDTHRMAYMTRSSQLPHDNGSPSTIRRNVSQQYPEPHLPNSTLYDNPDKMELLKMVYELEEMLNQSHISKKMQNRSHARDLGEENHTPHYYDNEATVRKTYANVKHSGNYGNPSQGLGFTHQPKISRVEFSGEATRCRNQMDCVCSRCCHPCWYHTTKSCSHCISSQHAIHPGNNYDNGYPSYSQSPQTHSNHKFFSQVFERKADKQLQKKKNMKKLCLREKYQTIRRHLLPVAGGAPIMACHYCSELLQLPAEHTLSNRRCYQLRCYSCERIMKLSLEKKVHLVPYLPTSSAPPPSENDHWSHAKNGGVSGNHQ